MPQGDAGADVWRWSLVSPGQMAALRDPWQSLADRVGLPAIAGPAWTVCFYRAFREFQGSSLHVLHHGNTLAAVIPLKRESGVRTRWAGPVHAHLPEWTCAVDTSLPGIVDEILDHLLASAGALDLEPLSGQDVLYRALQERAHARGLGTTVEARHPEAVLDLFAPWDGFCKTIPGGVKQSLQKQRQLERLGQLAFTRVGDRGESPSEVLRECFALEAAGWKGEHGVPMCAREDTRTFYQDLVREAAEAGSLVLHTLRLDGRLIAFDLGLQSGSRVDALKISYDRELSRYSPGSVLLVLMLRREVEEGLVRRRHLGPASPWKAQWTTHVAPLFKLRIHRAGPVAGVMYGALPVVHERLRHSARVRAAVQGTRAALARGSASFGLARQRCRGAAASALRPVRWLARRQALLILRKPVMVAVASPHWVLEEIGSEAEAVIQTYRALGRQVPDAWLRRRCGQGQRFYVLKEGGHIVATTFVVPGGERFLDECAQGLAMPDASFWVRDIYVVPARRGERLFGTLLDVLIVRKYPGVHEVLSDVRADDAASLRAHRRYGFEVCGAVDSWHLAERVMWRSNRVPSLRTATVFAPGRRLFATGASFRDFSEAHSA